MIQEQMLRQWQIIFFLDQHRNGLTTLELAQRLGCSERTVYRDLLTLQSAYFPITSQKIEGQTRYCWSDEFGKMLNVRFNPSELLALYLASGLLSQMRGTLFEKSLDSLLNKIEETIPKKAREYFRKLEGSIYFSAGFYRDYKRHEKQLGAILFCLREKTTLRMIYRSLSRGELEREVDPYCLWFVGDSIYLIGFCHINKEVRTFLLDRIKHAEPTKKRFTVQDGFNFYQYTQESFRVMREGEFVDVLVWFDPRVAHVLEERKWHRTQRITKNPDGSIYACFRIAGISEFKTWILGFGELAKIEKPEWLRKEFKKTFEKLLKIYE